MGTSAGRYWKIWDQCEPRPEPEGKREPKRRHPRSLPATQQAYMQHLFWILLLPIHWGTKNKHHMAPARSEAGERLIDRNILHEMPVNVIVTITSPIYWAITKVPGTKPSQFHGSTHLIFTKPCAVIISILQIEKLKLSQLSKVIKPINDGRWIKG